MLTKLHNCEVQNKEWIALAKEAFEIQNQRKYYQAKEKELLDNLKALSDHKNATGGEFMFISIERKGTIDYKNIPELKLIDVEPYRKDSCLSWKLSKI